MIKSNLFYGVCCLCLLITTQAMAQGNIEEHITDEMLANPDPSDWLMHSRTYDNQRYSPLDQINRDNVGSLNMVWSRGMHPGTQEAIPLVHNGVMYISNPRGIVQALDATTGDLIWEYIRDLPDDIEDYVGIDRNRTLSIRGDRIFYAAPDGFMVAIGAGNGEIHWETQAHDYKKTTEYTTGPMIAGDKVITGRNCDPYPDGRENCFIGAYHAETGEEVWRFYAGAGGNDPGANTWGNKSEGSRTCSPWGLPGSYDPERNLVYWGIANPSPHTRYKRHDDPFDVPLTTPSELYCNSTLALNADTGELAWHYQHVPGDDWDSDWTQERVLFSSPYNPDPDKVEWHNPNVRRGEVRDMVATVGEPGGLWVMDRGTGEFLWGIPFPAQGNLSNFHISDVNTTTGQVSISRDTVLTGDNQSHTLCFSNVKGYYPMAYSPEENAMYIPYHDVCYTRTSALSTVNAHRRTSHLREGVDPNHWTGLAKVDMATGVIEPFHTQRNPTNGAVLATAGGLIFWGDMNRRFRAFDAKTSEILWETIVGGIVQNSTITYAVDGTQYVAILTGDGVSHTGAKLAHVPELKTARRHNAVYVFALPK